MDRTTRLNLIYAVLAIGAVLFLQSWWQAAQRVEPVRYSEFEQRLAAGEVAEVVVTAAEIRGHLKQAHDKGRREIVAKRVEPDLAARLSAYDVPYRRETESTLLRDLLAWVVPTLVFIGLWAFLLRRMTGKQE